MKSKKSLVCKKNGATIAIATVAFLLSCQVTEILSVNDTQKINSEIASEAYLKETVSMAGYALASVSNTLYNGGNTSASVATATNDGWKTPIYGSTTFDDRLTGATITLTAVSGQRQGTITVNFGSGCTDPRGIIRSGKLMINYKGPKWSPNKAPATNQSSTLPSYFAVHLVDYARGNTFIMGIDSLVTQAASLDSAHLIYTSTLTQGKVTFGDGKVVTRSHTLTREWIRSPSYQVRAQDQWLTFPTTEVATGIPSGNTTASFNGVSYKVDILNVNTIDEEMICKAKKVFVPVQGKKRFANGASYTIDYGTGLCDNLITVTLNGKSIQIAATTEGN